ncbi:MAG: RNA polymerase sigma factor [Solirubrobacteraceae bacterium]
MEASAIPASVGLARSRITIGASLLRIRTDEQLITLFREGNDEAFRVIHDRYRARMFAYARQMLGNSGQDPEDAVQEIFMRAYHGLRANHRQLALRAWLYRIAHNRCIDDLRRPQPLAIGTPQATASGVQDPVVRVEQRDALRRLIADVQRLPDQQRSALLMRELSGMSYADVSGALGVSVPAVKSLLVRARVGLAQASTARNTACAEIRADLVLAHDRGVRTSGLARRHLRECQGCREFRTEVRGVRRQLAALSPTLGPLGVIAHLLGWGSGGTSAAAGSGAVAGSSAAAGGGGAAAAGSVAVAGGSAVAAGGMATSAGLLASGAGHVVTLLAAAVVTAGGAVEIQRSLSTSPTHRAHRHHLVATASPAQAAASGSGAATAATESSRAGVAASPGGSVGGPGRAAAGNMNAAAAAGAAVAGTGAGDRRLPITMLLDPDMWSPNQPSLPGAAPTGASTSAGTGNPGTTSGATTTTPSAPGQTGAPTGTAATPSSTTPTSTPSATGTGTNTGAPSSTGSGTGSPSTPPPATSSGSTSNTGSPTTAGTTRTGSVGRSTSSASRGSVVSFIAKRHRARHRILRDKLFVP